MIEKMQKLSCFIYHQEIEKLLQDLQSLGLVHIETMTTDDEEIKRLESEKKLLDDALKVLKGYVKEEKGLQKEKIQENALDVAKKIVDRQNAIQQLQAEIQSMERTLREISVWGEFGPEDKAKLESLGLSIRFYVALESAYKRLVGDLPVEKINQIGKTVYFVAITPVGEEIEALKPYEVAYRPLSMEALEKEIAIREATFSEWFLELEHLVPMMDVLEREKLLIEDRLAYRLAEISAVPEAEGTVRFLQGWFPKKKRARIEALLQLYTIVYLIEDPKPAENVPVLLRNNPFNRLFEPILTLHSVPSYYEIDPTPLVAPFFALFFGLCMADVGYGGIMLLLTLGLVFLTKGPARRLAWLGVVFSVMTMLAGWVLNSFFGVQLTGILPSEWRGTVFFANINDAMAFSLMLGVLQLSIGLIVKIINKIRMDGVVYALHPLGTLLLLLGVLIAMVASFSPSGFSIGPFAVRSWVDAIPNAVMVGSVMVVVGVGLILLFNNPQNKLWVRPLLGLWELYGTVTGLPGDILSYIRLFALGLSGGMLGSAFNQIALMARGDNPGILNWVGMVLILVVGHGLNLALALLGAFVHPLRLTFLEFFKTMDYQGGGRRYEPFRHREYMQKE
ncbi:MAG: V-type ATP synthase subunit I [Brevinematales bacterium]